MVLNKSSEKRSGRHGRQPEKGAFSIKRGKSAVNQSGKCRTFLRRTNRPRRALLCQVPDSICRTSRKASRARKICPRPRSFGAAATSRIDPVPLVAGRVSATGPASGFFTTWGTWLLVARATSTSPTPGIAAPGAARISTRTRPTTPCPRPITPTAWSRRPSDSSWRTACRTRRPVGTCGAITASSSPTPPSRTGTGWRPGGEKGGRPDGRRLPGLGPG